MNTFRVYKVKYEKKIEDFLENGYDLMPVEIVEKENIIFKIIKMAYDSDAVKMVISIYNNEEWQKEYLSLEGAEEIYNSLGIFWEDVIDETGKTKRMVKESEDFLEMISTWRIEIDMDGDKMVGFTTGDMSFPYTYYNRSVLDKYCEEEVERLFDLGLIKISEEKEEIQ